jgi:hypothetical protein
MRLPGSRWGNARTPGQGSAQLSLDQGRCPDANRYSKSDRIQKEKPAMVNQQIKEERRDDKRDDKQDRRDDKRDDKQDRRDDKRDKRD